MKTIKKIVFTGGPCSGKTTFMSRAEEIFAERGYRVIVDHESATDLISGGISPATMGMYQFQKYCIGLQLKKEELCFAAAEEIEGDKVLVFIDRGILDDEGFVTQEEFAEIIKDFNMTKQDILNRYDMILHLVTSAKGAEYAYSFDTNSARYESAEEARKVDDTLLESWKDHPNRVIIGNEDDFEVKMRKAIQSVFQYLGDEKPVETFRKYLVEIDNDDLERIAKESSYSKMHIFQQYLRSTNTERRIRKREHNGSTLYYYSESVMPSVDSRVKRDRILSEREYFNYQSEVNPDLNPIDKERHSFYFDNHFCRLDIFNFDETKGLLMVQIPDEIDPKDIKLPEYLNVVKDVTDDSSYKNYYLAKAQKYK